MNAISPDSLKRDLANLSSDAARTARSEAEIMKASGERRDGVCRRMDELRSKVHVDHAAAEEYGALVAERGQLDLVLGHGS
jgi:hypothetical protein